MTFLRMDQSMMTGDTCNCPHHKVVPALITLIGLLFLLNAIGSISAKVLAISWPVALMLIGLQKLSRGMCRCCLMHK